MNRALADLGQAYAANRHVAGGTVQFLSMTFGAIQIRHAVDEAISGSLRGGLRVVLFQPGDDAFPRLAVLVL